MYTNVACHYWIEYYSIVQPTYLLVKLFLNFNSHFSFINLEDTYKNYQRLYWTYLKFSTNQSCVTPELRFNFCFLDPSGDVEKEDDLHYMESTDGYVVPLQKAYVYASKTLLELLVGEKDLIGHLRSVRHYFLMDQVRSFLTDV